MAAPRNYVVLSDKNLALVGPQSGVARKPFTQEQLSTQQTVAFETDSPCVAILDNDGVQWDLNSKRVWYKTDSQNRRWIYISIIDILRSKNMVNREAKLTVEQFGTYTRKPIFDTVSGYCWMNAELTPKKLYTRVENPVAEVDYAYESGKIPSPQEETPETLKYSISSTTNAQCDDIPGTWEALFAVTVSGGTSTYVGLEYTIVD